MSIRSQKTECVDLLHSRNQAALTRWACSVRNPFRVLISLTYDRDPLVRWRAIEAAGWTAATYAEARLDRVREMVWRIFWQMTDESGDMGWHSPELIGEILVNVPVLIPEYADLLLSVLPEEPFERGALFAICRVARVDATPFSARAAELAVSADNSEPLIRVYSAWSLGILKASDYRQAVARLVNDQTAVCHYDADQGEFTALTVAEAARTALDSIDSKDQAA